MLVRHIVFATAVAILVATPVAFAQKAGPNVYPDPGAGPVRVSPTACLLALRAHKGPPCPEPQLGPGTDKAAQAKAHLARAHYFIDIQELEKAYGEAKAAQAAQPDNVEALHLAARLALSTQDFEGGEAALASARRLAPDNADIAATAAFFLQVKQAPVESFRAFGEILKTHPDHRFAREQHAALLMQFHRAREALLDYDHLMKISPPDINLLQARANAYLAVNRAKDAVVDLSAAHAISPNRIDLMIARAKALVAAGDDVAAVKQYDALLETTGGVPIYPMFENDRAKLLVQRAHALVHLKRLDDAARDAVAAVTLGGRTAVLRAQVQLRRNGFPDVPINGENSPALGKALSLCFGLEVCFHAVGEAI
jgi:cytochrome c-type biogenesis protein CcmH/NrfG